MTGQKVPQVPDSHCLEQPEVRPKFIVAPQTQQFTLTDKPPRMLMSEPYMLPEVTKEVYQPKQRG